MPPKDIAEVLPPRPSVWPGFPPAAMVALLLGLFAACTVLVIAMRNHRRASMYLVFVLAAILLVFNAVYFGINRVRRGWYPVEFSHISYFVMAVSVVPASLLPVLAAACFTAARPPLAATADAFTLAGVALLMAVAALVAMTDVPWVAADTADVAALLATVFTGATARSTT